MPRMRSRLSLVLRRDCGRGCVKTERQLSAATVTNWAPRLRL